MGSRSLLRRSLISTCHTYIFRILGFGSGSTLAPRHRDTETVETGSWPCMALLIKNDEDLQGPLMKKCGVEVSFRILATQASTPHEVTETQHGTILDPDGKRDRFRFRNVPS